MAGDGGLAVRAATLRPGSAREAMKAPSTPATEIGILVECRRLVGGQEDMIIDIALNLAAQTPAAAANG
ncbi:DmpG-like protein [Streptomyces sp. TLI_171]|nr:DmpG-like protein [Streptomyces sp. TLI_171]